MRPYVKARYSKHFEISEEALTWLGERTAILLDLVALICEARTSYLQRAKSMPRREVGNVNCASLFYQHEQIYSWWRIITCT